ncbi:MAG: MFS transporter [Verrucomicrobia bacterium]|nr:MAG: MFS transporter [Verrucomicrobiota bacterium]
MNEKPQLSFWQIWNMSFGFLGIQFGWGLQMANMSSIYSFLGAKEENLALLWIAAPLTGLIVQPIVGYLSDRTWTGLGRRRPYFLIGAVLASAALVMMPHSSALWMAVGLLWILDASINITMEPFRAFVADKLPANQRPTGFTVQSLFIGLGAVIASALPYILNHGFGIGQEASGDSKIPLNVTISFHVGAAALFFAVLYTILTTPEYPPENMEEFQKMKKESAGLTGFLKELLHGIGSMPKLMRQLAWVQFFTWTGLFCMWIYWTPAIARQVFGGDPANKEAWKLVMKEAGEWTGICFSVYNFVCFIFSFVLLVLARSISAKTIHTVCLVVGGIGLIGAAFAQTQQILLGSMVAMGVAWASILSMPYAMLSSAIPAQKMGFYMGVFNFFIVLPQVFVSLVMGQVLEHALGGNTILVIVLGGISLFIAAAFNLRVGYKAVTLDLLKTPSGGH